MFVSVSPENTARSSETEYFDTVGNRAGISPAMREYMKKDNFDYQVERKKHQNLKTFFKVSSRQEKYHLMSKLLHEDKLRKAIDHTPTRSPKTKYATRNTVASYKARTRMSIWKQGKGRTLEFEDGISEIDEEIEQIVNDKFQKRKADIELHKRFIENQTIFNHLKKRVVPPKRPVMLSPQSLSPRSYLSSQSSEAFYPPLTSVQTGPAQELKRVTASLPRLKSLTPRGTISENLSMMRTLNKAFLGNVRRKGNSPAADEHPVPDSSVFLTQEYLQ